MTGKQVLRSHNSDDLDDSASKTNGVSTPERRPLRSSDGPKGELFLRLAITVDKQGLESAEKLFLELTLTQNNGLNGRSNLNSSNAIHLIFARKIV